MQIEQRRNLGEQNLRINPEKADYTEDFREQMLLNNDIEGLLKFEISNENGNRIYNYAIMGMLNLREAFSHRKIGTKELTAIIDGILKTIYHGKEFMLLEDDYMISPEMVFLGNDNNVRLVYCPGYNKNLRIQLKTLAEYLMDSIEYKDDEAVLTTYAFYMKMKDGACTLEELMTSLGDTQKENREEIEHIVKRESVSEAIITESAAFKEIRPDDRTYPEPDVVQVIKASSFTTRLLSLLLPLAIGIILWLLLKSGILINAKTGKNDALKLFACIFAGIGICTVVLRRIWGRLAREVKQSMKSAADAADEATVMLCNDGTARYPFSLVSDEYPAICVARTPFYVGKDASRVDYILNCTGVSRFHLKIDRIDDRYTVADLDSLNGVFVNGKRLKAYVPREVVRGDEVQIGACRFYCN